MQAAARIIGTLILTLAIVVRLYAVEPPLKKWTFSQFRMGRGVQFTLYAASKSVAERAAQAGGERLDEIAATAHELAKVCEAAGGDRVRVSEEFVQMVRAAKRISIFSGGAFDLTAAPARKLWSEARTVGAIPEAARLRDAMKNAGYEHLEIDSIFGYVRLSRPGMELDLNGIEIGFACDEALLAMRRAGVAQAMIQAGHHIVAGDAPPGAAAWDVTILGQSLKLANQAISAIDSKAVRFQTGNRFFAEIIDGRTGIASGQTHSVIVLGRSGIDTDPVSNAVFVLGSESVPMFEQKYRVRVAILQEPPASTSQPLSTSTDRRSLP